MKKSQIASATRNVHSTWSRSRGLLQAAVGLVLASLLCSVAGCTSRPDWRVMSNDSARLLTDTVFAAYVSRQSSDGHMSGYVLLVGRDGAVSAVKTSGMDNAALVWDNQGLYFSDTSRDYLLTETGMRTWDSPKTDFQTAAYANPDGGWVSIYNLGFGAPGDEMGYVEQVVVTSANGAVRYDVPGFITATAQCGSQVFSLAEVVSPFTSLAQDMGAVIRDYPPFWPDMLTQVYPQPPTPSDALVSILQTSSGGTAFTSTCRDQQMLVIGAGSWVPPKPRLTGMVRR